MSILNAFARNLCFRSGFRLMGWLIVLSGIGIPGSMSMAAFQPAKVKCETRVSQSVRQESAQVVSVQEEDPEVVSQDDAEPEQDAQDEFQDPFDNDENPPVDQFFGLCEIYIDREIQIYCERYELDHDLFIEPIKKLALNFTAEPQNFSGGLFLRRRSAEFC